jgi:hypothetical protein
MHLSQRFNGFWGKSGWEFAQNGSEFGKFGAVLAVNGSEKTSPPNDRVPGRTLPSRQLLQTKS